MAKTLTIGIDCRLEGPKHAGIGRYLTNFLLQIPEIPTAKKYQWVFFFHDQQQWHDFLDVSKKDAFFKSQQVVFAPIRHYTFDEQLRMPGIFAEQNLDLLHIPHFNIPLMYPGKIVTTIHDLLWHEYRGTHVTTLSPAVYWLKHAIYRLVVAQAVRKAAKIFVPAKTTSQTLFKYFPTAKSKTVVTYEGIDPSFKIRQLSEPARNNQLQSSKLIYVGSMYPHKNLEVVFQMLKLLPEYSLSIVGARNVFSENMKARVVELGISQQVDFLGYVPDDKLPELFAKHLALVQPSLSEGFGLTGLEALSRGLPVICSDIPIFEEIYGQQAVLFDPHNAQSLAEAVSFLKNPQHYQKYSSPSASFFNRFNWKTMTREMMDCYAEVLS